MMMGIFRDFANCPLHHLFAGGGGDVEVVTFDFTGFSL